MSDRFGSIEIEKPPTPPDTGDSKKVSRGRTGRSRKTRPVRKSSQKASRHWFWLILLVIVIALYSAFGFLGVPYYFTKIFPNRFYQNTGMVFISENLQFNPYSFVLKTGPTQIVDSSGTKIVTFDSLYSSLKPLSLLRRDMVCSKVSIERPEIHLIREYDGKYNLGKILGDATNDYDKEIIHFSDLPIFFSLNNITIRNGTILFEDLPASKTHKVENLELDLPTFSNIPVKTESSMRPHFSATVNGSPIELTGQVRLSDKGDEHEINKLTCALNDIDLQTYINYLPFNLPFDVVRGRAKGTIDLTFDSGAEKGNKFSFGFNLQLIDTEFKSNNGALSFSSSDALIQGGLLPVSRTLAFTKIVLNSPLFHSYGPSLLSNLDTVLAGGANPERPILTKKPPINLAINALTIENGQLAFYADRKEKKPYSEWKTVHLDIKDFSSAQQEGNKQEPGTFHLTGELGDSSAHLSWDGTFDVDGHASGVLKIAKYDAGLLFKNLDIAALQSAKGVAAIKGDMELFMNKEQTRTLQYKLSNAELSVDNFEIADNKTTFLTAQSLQSTRLIKSPEKFDLGTVTIKNGSLSLQKGQLPDLFKKFTSKTQGPTVDSLSFMGTASIQTGPTQDKSLAFEELSLNADNLGNTKTTEKNLELVAKSAAGEMINLEGTVDLKPFQLSSDIVFRKLPIQALLPLFSETVFLRYTQGFIGGEGKLILPGFSFSGEIETSAMKIDSPDFPQFAWQKSSFTKLNFTSDPLQLRIDDASIDSPEMSVDLSNSDGNPITGMRSFFQAHFPPQESSTAPGKTGSAVPPLDIENISIENGRFIITDQRLTPLWNTKVEKFTGKIRAIHSSVSAKSSVFSSTGTLDDIPFTLSGDLDLFGERDNSEYAFSISDYPLAAFQKQLQSRDSLNIDKATFGLSHKSVSSNDLNRKTGEIVFTDLQAASGYKEAALTLAFLTDADNHTTLEYDFEDQEPGRSEPLFEQILTLINIKMIKGAVSPLLLTDGEFNELIGNEFIEFTPGEILLSENGRNALTRYTALLIAHPKIGLVLSGGYDSRKDYTAIKEQLEKSEQKRVESINATRAAEWQAEKKNYEEKLADQKNKLQQSGTITEREMPQSLLEGFTPVETVPVVVDEVMLLELAEKRLDIIKQFFTSQLALQPGRIKLVPPDSKPSGQDQPVDGVMITLIPVDL